MLTVNVSDVGRPQDEADLLNSTGHTYVVSESHKVFKEFGEERLDAMNSMGIYGSNEWYSSLMSKDEDYKFYAENVIHNASSDFSVRA
ncbi:hypothetical protein L6452_36207 [Arctium lappa]|uniref:Uncharacterized protein n=1 Tax=Arctium lappa TaxID=4217 RepID=A0ACB8YA16_ARCLA|nr:hypothetical protein L6452_36207 [Arctium lappa]